MSYKLNLLDEKLFNKFSNALKSFKDKYKKFSWDSWQTKELYTDRQIEKIGQKQSNQQREIDLNIVQLKLTFLSEDELKTVSAILSGHQP